MRTSVWTRIRRSIDEAKHWYLNTPERSLEQAYDAALMIKAIEDEHFDGNKITAESSRYSDSVLAYFQAELKKHLKTAELRLMEFKASNTFLNNSNSSASQNGSTNISSNQYSFDPQDKPTIIVEKLKFIDEVLARYKQAPVTALTVTDPVKLTQVEPEPVKELRNPGLLPTTTDNGTVEAATQVESVFSKSTFLPRSIIRTVNRFKREMDPHAENEVINSFRNSRVRTKTSLRFLLLLILLPLLAQQTSKFFLFGPIVNSFENKNEALVFLNAEQEEKAFVELQRFEERLRFEALIGKVPELPQEEFESKVQAKATSLAEEYAQESFDVIKNIFSDVLAAGTFALLLITGKRELAILKAFIDELIYGLSDSAKAFVIILFTDVFVGFHSTHGWEVLLEGLLRHFGLPENRDFIFIFIATFPVILDAMFKYWIFRYLNRISPSAVATYRNMNE